MCVCEREAGREVLAGTPSLPSGKQHLSLHFAPPLFPLGISPTIRSSAFSSPEPPKSSRASPCAPCKEHLTLSWVLCACLRLSLPAAAEVGVWSPWPSLAHCLSLALPLRCSCRGLWMDCVYLHSSRRLWTLQVCEAVWSLCVFFIGDAVKLDGACGAIYSAALQISCDRPKM